MAAIDLPFSVDLKDQIAVVTGGGGVLCSEMAMALAACGARIILLSRRQEKADAAAQRIRTAGYEAEGFACDILDRPALEAVRDEVLEKYGRIDVLINGAGGNDPRGTASVEQITPESLAAADESVRTFFELDPEGLRFVFDVNYIGTVVASQVFAKTMAETGNGTIINVSSMSAFKPLTKVAAYSSAKAAINNFTQWLAVHLAPAGVRVNAIAPGFFLTEQNRTLLTNPDGSYTPRADKIVSNTPMGRFGDADELIGALLYLSCRKSSGFVTGTILPVDGGFDAFSGV
jgi:NAD(P)-dependent dehydrogenase (short-subunit alcohol dehydrogenase family)